MKYYFIYSAGGGGGEWDGLKRIWKQSMKPCLKDNLLLKFGDIFINHRSSDSPIRPIRWSSIKDLRQWLFDATNDEYVLDSSNILLDSGSAKIVSWLAYVHSDLDSEKLIKHFDDIYQKCDILEKYVSIIKTSRINHAVSFDMPNPFKVRSQGIDNRLNLLERESAFKFIDITAKYANELHKEIGDTMLTTINGQWSNDEYSEFFEKLDYTPKGFAVGGLSQARSKEFFDRASIIRRIQFPDGQVHPMHFLGCAGIDKVTVLRDLGFIDSALYSADCSTPINRSFSDRISNYYDYSTGKKTTVVQEHVDTILYQNSRAICPYYSNEELKEILIKIIAHQNGLHSYDTFSARAQIMLHNSDVFRQWAEKIEG